MSRTVRAEMRSTCVPSQMRVRPYNKCRRMGALSLWAHSGRELFYKGSGNLMAVEVLRGATFVTGERRVLFSVQGFRSATVHQQYDVTPDDQRFVMIRNRVADEGELIVVENLFEELKAKVGN